MGAMTLVRPRSEAAEADDLVLNKKVKSVILS